MQCQQESSDRCESNSRLPGVVPTDAGQNARRRLPSLLRVSTPSLNPIAPPQYVRSKARFGVKIVMHAVEQRMNHRAMQALVVVLDDQLPVGRHVVLDAVNTARSCMRHEANRCGQFAQCGPSADGRLTRLMKM
jgi:hypothetical protein